MGSRGKSLKTAGQTEPGTKSKMFLVIKEEYLGKYRHSVSTEHLTKTLILLFIAAKSIICPLLVYLILPAIAAETAVKYDLTKNTTFMVLTIDGKTGEHIKIKKLH